MDSVIKYFDNIETGFRRMKFITVASLAASALVAVASVFIAISYVWKADDQVFVIENGAAMVASAAPGGSQKDLEVQDHLVRFHELMFNLSPSSESISRNIDRALVMSDRSAYDYWRDLSERGFYQRLVSANISQQIVVDSVRTNLRTYPYESETFGKLYLIRESNITAYQFESTCRLVDVERSESNPHGLMIEKFTVRRNENIGTKRRR